VKNVLSEICTAYGRVTTIFQNFSSHLEIAGARMLTYSKFHTAKI
jgi:hypothetical protein